VLKQVVAFLRDRGPLLDDLRFKRKSPDLISALLVRAAKLADACDAGSFASRAEIVAALVRRITVAQDQVTIEIDRNTLAERLLDQESASISASKNRGSISLEVPVRFRRRGVEAKLIVLRHHGPAAVPDAKSRQGNRPRS
jgi:site-specific DNA recombinase